MDSATKPAGRPVSPALVVMGVAGCGKSSLGQACAEALGWPLLEGDEYHPAANIEKMRVGIALTDADREGWLDRLGSLLRDAGNGAVLTCSALRQRYRDRLRSFVPGLRFAFLELGEADAYARVAARPNHPFPPSLVRSQFATLESPVGEPGVLRLDALRPLCELRDETVAWMRGELDAKESA
ncbi:gluconokinase [Caldimonas thermodepolymerans]|nr:gluconokinase [Caldimonas thermodepolymerans]UZG47003.1 gluconokinase [Caldimonas thermodepolymerans]